MERSVERERGGRRGGKIRGEGRERDGDRKLFCTEIYLN